jgi:hypothetical protein
MLIKDIPRPRGFRILLDLILYTWRALGENILHPILSKLDSRFLPPILQTFKYKVKIETAKQDTEH